MLMGALLRGAKLIWSPEIFFFTLSKGFGKPNQKTQSDLAWFRQIIRRRVESGYAFIRPSTTQKHECLAGPVEISGTVGIFSNQILQRRCFLWYLFLGKMCENVLCLVWFCPFLMILIVLKLMVPTKFTIVPPGLKFSNA